jgi:hypothetical protein
MPFLENTRQTLKGSAFIRMNYICIPGAGALFKTFNFFQGGSYFNLYLAWAGQASFELPNLANYSTLAFIEK